MHCPPAWPLSIIKLTSSHIHKRVFSSRCTHLDASFENDFSYLVTLCTSVEMKLELYLFKFNKFKVFLLFLRSMMT